MKTPILLALLTLLGTSVLFAQQGARDPGERRAGGLPLFESGDLPGYALRDAGRRTKTRLNNGRERLEYVLTTKAELADEGSGEMSFFERWLVDRLGADLGQLESVELVDRTERRIGNGKPQSSSERAIVVQGGSEAILAAERFLDQVIHANRSQVLVQAVLVSVETEPGPDPETIEIRAMDREACEQRKKSYKDGSADVILSPRLLTLGGQSSMITVGKQIAFVLRHEAQVVGESLVLNPVVDTVWDGVSIGITPVIGPEGRRLHLRAAIEMAILKRPLQTVELTLSSHSGKVKIEVPEISTVDWSSDSLVLEESECAVEVRGLRLTEWTEEGEKRRRDISLLLEFNIQKQAEAEAPTTALARVLGYDPRNRKAFIKIETRYAPVDSDSHQVIFKRDGKTVGKGRLLESREGGVFIVIQVVEGEAKEGDYVRFFAR